MKNKNRKILLIGGSVILVIVVLTAALMLSDKDIKPLKAKNPYTKEQLNEDNFGEIAEEKEEEFDGEDDLTKGQAIDSNKITYLRQVIPSIKSSILIPQGWDIREDGVNVFITPPKDSDLKKVQIAINTKESPAIRDPDSLTSEFLKYKREAFVYKNDNFRMIPKSYQIGETDILYDTKNKIFMHKERERDFEQLTEIPKGLDKNNFVEKDRFVGVMEKKELPVREKTEPSIKGRVFTRFFHTFTGEHKSLLVSFTAPRNLEMELDEIARVVSLSIRDEKIKPANKSNATPVNIPMDMDKFKYYIPESFNQVSNSYSSYYGKAYNNIFDKSYGIRYLLKDVSGVDSYIFEMMSSGPIHNEFKKQILETIYEDDRDIVNVELVDMFNFKIMNKKDKEYMGRRSFEYVLYIEPKDESLIQLNQLDMNIPVNAIVTIMPKGESYLFSMTTFDTINYELARTYNDAILKSIKEK